MREIKFRAWNIATKTMVDLKKITPLALNIDTDGLFIPFSDGLPLMQYTGLHDKNGKSIYDKDVLDWEEMKFVIEWDNIQGCWYGKPSYNNTIRGILTAQSFSKSINIGNIYENKELIKEV